MTSTASGTLESSVKYLPFGGARPGTGPLPTEVQFTGQRLDGTGLYYYGARYYDAEIGRFISADPTVPSLTNSQALNRYSYAFNNPLRYIDPTGLTPRTICDMDGSCGEIDDDDLTLHEQLIAGLVEGYGYGSEALGDMWRGTAAAQVSAFSVVQDFAEAVTGAVADAGTAALASAKQATGIDSVQVEPFPLPSLVPPAPILPVVTVRVTESSPAAAVMRKLPTGDPVGAVGVTANPFIFIRKDHEYPKLQPHEKGHVLQQRLLGPVFWPLYGLGSLLGYRRNPFELLANKTIPMFRR